MIEVYLGYQDVPTLVDYANAHPETEVIGIDISQEPISKKPINLRLVKADFLLGLKDSTTKDSVNQVASNLAFGYYGRMGHRTWDCDYTAEVAGQICSVLREKGEFRTIVMKRDGERIQTVLDASGFYIGASPISDGEAESTNWMKMLQIHQCVPLELLVARCSKKQ